MIPSDDIVLFLGAGASLPLPAGGPLFELVRDALATRAGVDPRRWDRVRTRDRRRALLLDHVIPEVFLKEFADAGYELHEPLAAAVHGTPGTGPNAVHELAADVMRAGGRVWTTNWDTWIERAWGGDAPSMWPDRAVAPDDDPNPDTVLLYKLHGTTERPETLLFATPQIMRPVAADWRAALLDGCRDRTLVVVGYAGVDIDLYPALREAIAASKVTFWLEGAGTQLSADEDPRVSYERWRFGLHGPVDPSSVPASGAHLVWCGKGSTVADPSAGLLTLFGRTGGTDRPTRVEQAKAVDHAVATAKRRGGWDGRRLLLSARVRERLGKRWSAALRHAGVLVVGPSREYRRKAGRSIANMVLLRAQPLRTAANRVAVAVSRSEDRSAFLIAQAGGVDYDATEGRQVADGTTPVTVDGALTVAQNARWAGDLAVAEQIARIQFDRALAEDLSDPVRDWPERVARSCFEIAQAQLWQGRLWDMNETCKSGYMRVAGAKWAAWEHALIGAMRFAERNYSHASAELEISIELLYAEGFQDFTPQLHTSWSACARMLGIPDIAAAHLAIAERAPRKGPGTLATILAERAELAIDTNDLDAAVRDLEALTSSRLPMWSAFGHLRLAELGRDEDTHASFALVLFDQVGNRWGSLRTRSLTGAISDSDREQEAAQLGPPDIYRPHEPWLF
jgi:SIR2-like domain